MERRRKVGWLLALYFAVGIGLSHSTAAQTWVPERNVELVVPAAPGSSMDVIVRTVERIVREFKLAPVSIAVVNRAGGEHAVAYNYIKQRTGDPHYLSLTSQALLANHISGVLPLTYTDVTPIASFISEYYAFLVQPESPIKTGKDFVQVLKEQPDSVSIAVGNIIQRIAVGLVLQSGNVDIKRVRMAAMTGAKTTPTLMGGHVDVAMAAIGAAIPLIEAGKVRAIAVSGPKRVGGPLAAVPTWAELGYSNSSLVAWRGMIAPKEITPAQIVYWEGVLRLVTENKKFREMAERQQYDVEFRNAAETRKLMEAEYAQLKQVMGYLGVVVVK